MSPMFTPCMQSIAGPPPHLGGPPPNGPPPPNHQQPPPQEPGFYSPAPHFNNQPTPPHPPINFNNQIRNIAGPRPPNYCTTIYEIKVYELTKRLTERPDNADNLWWDHLVSEFFDDHSTLTIQLSLEDGPKQHTIGRSLIPRYFRTMFEDGVIDFSIRLKRPFIKEQPNRIVLLEYDQCTLISQHGKPGYNKHLMHYPGMDPQMMKENKEIGLIVTTDGRLILEFLEDTQRIKTWNFTSLHFQELVPKNYVAMHAQQDALDQLTKNITRQGFTNAIMSYLKLCVLLEPMQMIMSRHKEMESTSPRDCLKNVIRNLCRECVQKANVCAPQEQQRPTGKKRRRKSSTPNNATGGGGSKKKNNAQMSSVSPGTPNFPLAAQDVMVVGEPSLMGGEFGDEDERIITRLENNQYDSSTVPTNGLDENVDFGSSLGGPPPNSNQQPQSSNPQQPGQPPVGAPSVQQPPQQQINPNQPLSNQQPGNGPPPPQQWSHQVPQQQQPGGVSGSVNNSNGNNSNGQQGNGLSNPPSIGAPSSIEDKKPSPISQ